MDNSAIKEKCKAYNMKYFETSAKKNYNMNELFYDIVKENTLNTLNILESESQYIDFKNSCLNCNIM